jgi:hypothetical protein
MPLGMGGTDTQSRRTRLRGLREDGGGVNRESPNPSEGDLEERIPSEDESLTEKGSVWKLTVREWLLRDGNSVMLSTITYKHIVYSHLLVCIVRIASTTDTITSEIVFIISQLNHVIMN